LTGEEFKSALATVDMVPKSQGMCVECVTDCDCSVNEFCGYDFDDSYDKDTKEWTYTYKVTIPAGITSANTGGGMPAGLKKEVELYAKQVEGLPIKSKCKKYSTSHLKGTPKVCDANMDLSAFGKMVEQSLLSGPDDMLSTCAFVDSGRGSMTTVKRTPQTWPKDAQGVWSVMHSKLNNHVSLLLSLLWFAASSAALQPSPYVAISTPNPLCAYLRADRFCGRLLSFGPKFFETKFIGQVPDTSLIKNAEFQMSAEMSTGNFYDDLARCVPVSLMLCFPCSFC